MVDKVSAGSRTSKKKEPNPGNYFGYGFMHFDLPYSGCSFPYNAIAARPSQENFLYPRVSPVRCACAMHMLLSKKNKALFSIITMVFFVFCKASMGSLHLLSSCAHRLVFLALFCGIRQWFIACAWFEVYQISSHSHNLNSITDR